MCLRTFASFYVSYSFGVIESFRRINDLPSTHTKITYAHTDGTCFSVVSLFRILFLLFLSTNGPKRCVGINEDAFNTAWRKTFIHSFIHSFNSFRIRLVSTTLFVIICFTHINAHLPFAAVPKSFFCAGFRHHVKVHKSRPHRNFTLLTHPFQIIYYLLRSHHFHVANTKWQHFYHTAINTLLT